jgi:tetratricopeptide (TPR) repeat protein
VDLDLSDFLEKLPTLGSDPSLCSRLLLAARRYLDYGRGDLSIQIYQWLYLQYPESLSYGDLMKMAFRLIDAGRIAEASEIARRAVGPERVQRPGFHYILALDHAQREDAQEAYEEAFLEMGLFGMYGEVFEDAREVCRRITAGAADPLVGILRAFTAHREEADQALERGDRARAVALLRLGWDALLAGQSYAHRDFVFLRQLISDVTLAISELEGKNFDATAEAAQAVLALRADFVPALMNLGRKALLRGDRKAAYTLWQQAHAIAPFHSIVFDKRQEFQYGRS